MTLPSFTYHPDPLATGVFKPEPATCQCCHQVKNPIYRGPFYSRSEVDALCAECIASGAAAKKFEGHFNDVWIDEGTAPREIIAEIAQRTPGYESWQDNEWLYHCNDGCEFHGDATMEDVANASAGTIALWEETNDNSWSEWIAPYEPGGSVGVYKFVCRHCSLVQFRWDLS